MHVWNHLYSFLHAVWNRTSLARVKCQRTFSTPWVTFFIDFFVLQAKWSGPPSWRFVLFRSLFHFAFQSRAHHPSDLPQKLMSKNKSDPRSEFVSIIAKRCLNHVQIMFKTCPKHVRHVRNMLEACPKHAWDIPETCPKHASRVQVLMHSRLFFNVVLSSFWGWLSL